MNTISWAPPLPPPAPPAVSTVSFSSALASVPENFRVICVPFRSRTTVKATLVYTVYVRGLAYLAAHQGPEAAAEFQKIIDGRDIVVSDPIGALAHLQIGRSFALSGDKTKAKTAYQDFLMLWKDADPDIPIPILVQARKEYDNLK